ncbi:sacsin-like isoform X2 [Saccostrea cucullata]|uniref:sacsin-like isoform X2 n=1 Tax=Saccostrea cuccullata TaxID=36930 RepID=UPI002ED470FF
MADDVNSDSDDEIEYSGMIQPPLIKQLRTILSEYPDDGQILKEIIQNAEDAGATEMKILYDGRRTVQHESTKKAPFRKYFKGPALLVYNNAVFSDEDWTGIKMLYSSIKEFDRTKVGRFGLGFKSVFHITDHPLIISGKQLLVIDPHQDSAKVCQTMQLRKLHKYKKMKVEDCLEAFKGVFGFGETTLDSGHFEGTIFRFPLRQIKTNLSDNLYDKLKVNDLFRSFEDEAPVSLLFLKSLESITLLQEEELTLNSTANIGKFKFSVKIHDSTVENVRSKRAEMREKVQNLEKSLPSDSILNTLDITICVTGDELDTTKRWKVMNLFEGEENMSPALKSLSRDESLSYSPHVGVAMDMDHPLGLKGHVFCFLPLPLSEKSLSGLPVHVNGFFALSQNRRVVKWPTADQIHHKAHTDKAIQWNQALVSEVLSDLYCKFIKELIEESKKQDNEEKYVTLVSHCIPDISRVEEHWNVLISPLVSKLKDVPIYFTPNAGGKWIEQKEAVFFRPGMDEDVAFTVRRVLAMYKQNTVEVEEHVWRTMQLEKNCEVVTTEFLYKLLKKSGKYKNCTDQEKFHLIQFLLSSGNKGNLDGLSLLPLQNGSFTEFLTSSSSETVYMVSAEDSEILIGMEDVMLRTLPEDLHKIFSDLIADEIYQVRDLDRSEFVNLLGQTIKKNIGDGPNPRKWIIPTSSLDNNWLQKVWKSIFTKFPNTLDHVSQLPIIPKKVSHTEIQMFALTDNLIQGGLSENMTICLGCLSVIVLESLPEYILQDFQIQKFVKDSSALGVFSAIEKVGQRSDLSTRIEEFNRKVTQEQKTEFLEFFSRERQTITEFSRRALKKLKLFKSQEGFVSIHQNQRILTMNLPVSFPSDVIVTSNADEIHFAKQLGGRKLDEKEIFQEILLSIIKKKIYSQEEVNSVMEFIIEKKIYKDANLLQLVKNVPFVPTEKNEYKKASDLFDPDDDIAYRIVLDETQFPAKRLQAQDIHVLRKFGLKSYKDISGSEIYRAAMEVHQKSVENCVSQTDRERQEAILKVLEKQSSLFNEFISSEGNTLGSLLKDLEIIYPLENPSSPIPNLHWFKSKHFFCKPSDVYLEKHEFLVGYVAPLVPAGTAPILVQQFGWSRSPDVNLVLQQHSKIVEHYTEYDKSEYFLPIKRLYEFLADCHKNNKDVKIHLKMMWMGDGFVSPERIFIDKGTDDIQLQPYLVPLPKEFQTGEIKSFGKYLGCKQKQTTETLIEVLDFLKAKYSERKFSSDRIRLDLDIIVRILNELKLVSDVQDRNVPIPIHSSDKMKLEFRPANECSYCNAEWLKDLAEEEGELMCFVHEDVTSDTAAKLGVPSLTENLLSETEGIQEWGQSEPLTRRIKTLLMDYKDGFAVPKEIVQNADDAKASKVCFLYDERDNMNCRTRLIDEHMATCQGPALWAYNDALFTKKDLENITKLSGATKAEDLSKVGKFGLGFCSVYNLTDVPSFISGSNMVIFDPHAKYLGKAVKTSNPGIKIDLTATKNKTLLRRMRNQFQPFNNVFECRLDVENPSFPGTLFRFPLRTKEQSCHSEISDKHYDEREMKGMIQLFVENAGNLLLFTQHVKEIEFYHLKKSSSADSKVLLHRVCIEDSTVGPSNTNILSSFGISFMNFKNGLTRDIPKVLNTSLVTVSQELTKACQAFCKSKEGKLHAKWLVSWASGTNRSFEMALESNLSGALPLAGTALYLGKEAGSLECKSLKSVPEGFYKESHLFCYLPLPVTTELPVHINGSFAISSNRRQLSSKTADDKTDWESQWNEALFADAVTNAYIHMVESLEQFDIYCENYFNLWPNVSNKRQNSSVAAVYSSFYRNVIDNDHKVFSRERKWISISNVIFLDVRFSKSTIETIVADAIIKYMERDGKLLIKLEKQTLENFKHVYKRLPEEIEEKIISIKIFFQNIFLKNISDPYWTNHVDSIVLFALDNQEEGMKSIMQETACIPTRPNGTLRKPCDLVKSNGTLSDLFGEDDERFVSAEFQASYRLDVLKSMGMMVYRIRDDVLLEQIHSVQKIASTCVSCCLQRCKSILQYMLNNIKETSSCQKEGKNIPFLPVLPKPSDWKLPWLLDNQTAVVYDKKCKKHESESTSFALAKPSDLFQDDNVNLVGCQELLLNTSLLNILSYQRHILTKIGVRGRENVQKDVVIQQLLQISNSVDLSSLEENEKEHLRKVCTDMYNFFDKVCKADEFQNFETLQNEPCLLIDDAFVRPKKVANFIPLDCSPALYGLGRISWSRNTHFLEQIGVKKEFDTEDIILALTEMSEQHTGKLEQTSLELACKLVKFLAKKMRTNSQSKDLSKLRIPDEHGCFSPISELCLNDSTLLKKGQNLKYLNENITDADAKVLGVQSKIKGSLKDYTKNLLPFGQKEELTNRIKKILKQYPQSEGILKEMLQNADDAKATEVMFISDFNQYETEKTFGEEWHPLQGPALLVYNNSYFTEDDIKGIQHLGQGSKEDDPTKTGQYGIGFNAVYHITDVPSFISKAPNKEETFCVMDPHCRYAPNASEYSPGTRFTDLDELRQPFSDVFKCYHENLLPGGCGTVFRLPLRQVVSDLSDKIVTTDTIKDMLETLKSEMTQCLLFLKSVKKISIATIKEKKIEVFCSSELSISKEDQEKKLEFDKYVREKAISFQEKRELFSTKLKEVAYNVTLKDASDHERKWLLIQRYGFSKDISVPKSVEDAIEDKTLGLLPQGGIAMPLQEGALSHAKAFCFLPLPCTTGLSVHINGHFSLDESRRGLWNDDKKKEYRTQWNYLILCDIIAPIYAKAIEVQCKAFKEEIMNAKSQDWKIRQQLKNFHSFFPNFEDTSDHYWKHLTAHVYRNISGQGLEVFISCHTDGKDQFQLSTYSLQKDSNDICDVVFNVEHQKSEEEDKIITEIAKDLGMHLADTPVWICKCIEKADVKCDQLSPNFLTTFLKSKHCNVNNLLECESQLQLHKTPFKELKRLYICIEFCQKSEDFESRVEGLPLCLLESGVLNKFKRQSPVIRTSFFELLPSSFSKMLHHELHGLFSGGNSGCVIALDIKSFVDLLPDDLNYDKYRHKDVKWNPMQPTIPNGKWIKSVWNFLHESLQTDHDQIDIVRLLHQVLPWSLIPTTQTSISRVQGTFIETVQTLYPLENAKRIIELDSFQPDLQAALKKLNLPLLESLYIKGSCPVRKLIASRERITDVLECLHFHKQSISETDTLQASDCDKIMEYFAGGLKTLLTSIDRQRCVDMLRALPLFRTIHDMKINLLQIRHILVLPSKLPSEGMNEWAERTSIILLRHNERLEEMYKLFNVTEHSICESYRVHILPNFDNIPRDDRVVHLAFIRDEILKSSGKYTEDQEKLIRALKELKFVPLQNGQSETASSFYSPFNSVMQIMLEGEEEKFPPLPFCNTEWKQFMVLAGMISEMTPPLFMRFARKLEDESNLNLLDQNKIKIRSEVLVKHLLINENLHQNTFLQNVGKVKFVYPYKVHNFYSDIALPANDKKDALISFHGSVTPDLEALVWTECFIIPEYAAPKSILFGDKRHILVHLGIQEPRVETVIEHIKKVCLNLSKQSEPQLKSMGVGNVLCLMKKFYKYLNNKLKHLQVCRILETYL